MPYIVSNLSLTTAEFGYVISAFGLAKLIGNIPSAILVERHGRKPYLVYSLLAVGAGTAGIGFAGGEGGKKEGHNASRSTSAEPPLTTNNHPSQQVSTS